MKTSKPLRLNGKIIPAGTVLQFGTEGYANYKGMSIHRSQIPAVAVESAPSQKRVHKTTSTLLKSVQIGDTVIPAGEALEFNAEGMCEYAGESFSIYQFPSKVFTGASESLTSATLAKSIRLGETVIPAGEALEFNAEGIADYNGTQLSIYQIPSRAFVGAESDETIVNNQLNTEAQYKSFDALEPGDLGTNAEGETVRFLGKAVGKTGYDALVGQFGDASGKTFEEITAGMSDDELNDTKFVAYTIPDGTVCVGTYDKDHVVAVESDGGEFLGIEEVASGDKAVDADGDAVTIVAKGKGTVWYKSMLDALKLECRMDKICKRLSMEDDDDFFKNADYVLVVDGKNNKFIDVYGANGVKVIKKED